MSATPPKRPAARHSKDFLSRMEQARLRRAETLQVRASLPPKPVFVETVLPKAPVASTTSRWLDILRIAHLGYAATSAFFLARLRDLVALPLVRKQDVQLLWALPVLGLLGLMALMIRGVDAPQTLYVNDSVNAAATQLVSARVPNNKIRLNVASVLPHSAAILGAADIELFGHADTHAPKLTMGPAISFQPPSPRLAGLVLPPQPSVLSAEPVAPVPNTIVAQAVLRSGGSAERPIRVFVPDGISSAVRQAVIEKVSESITPHVSARDVPFEVSQSHIRVYAEDDMPEAERMAATLGYLLRDMTTHLPKPPAGLIEIYIAGLPLDAEPIAQQGVISTESVGPTGQGVAATRAAIDEVLRELAPQPAPGPSHSTGHVRPQVVYETQVIETSKPAQKRGLLGRIFQN